MLDNVLDFILGGRRTASNNLPSVEDTRLLGLSNDNSLTFQAPDMSAQSQFAARVAGRLGGNQPDLSRNLKTRTSTLELSDDQITRNEDGSLEIDFTQFGGKKFKGTLEELSTLQGSSLMNVIGASAVDVASGNTLPNNVVQGQRLTQGNGVTKESVTNSLVAKVAGNTTSAVNANATAKPTSFLELSDIDSSIDKGLADALDRFVPDNERKTLLDDILNRAQGAVNATRGSN